MQTLALIKPDAVQAGRAREIKQLIELDGFTILEQRQLQMTPQRASEFYKEHDGKPFFGTLVGFMTSGPVWALLLSAPDAIPKWRTLMGPTNSDKARAEAPTSLRAIYDGTRNATHGSDSPASAAREIQFFFPHRSPQPQHEPVAAAMPPALEATLKQGLTQLAREKPSSSRLDAVQWLGSWLLQNNPNSPKTVAPNGMTLEDIDDGADLEPFVKKVQSLQDGEGGKTGPEALTVE